MRHASDKLLTLFPWYLVGHPREIQILELFGVKVALKQHGPVRLAVVFVAPWTLVWWPTGKGLLNQTLEEVGTRMTFEWISVGSTALILIYAIESTVG